MHQQLAVICGKIEWRLSKLRIESPVSQSGACIPESMSLSHWLDTKRGADPADEVGHMADIESDITSKVSLECV